MNIRGHEATFVLGKIHCSCGSTISAATPDDTISTWMDHATGYQRPEATR